MITKTTNELREEPVKEEPVKISIQDIEKYMEELHVKLILHNRSLTECFRIFEHGDRPTVTSEECDKERVSGDRLGDIVDRINNMTLHLNECEQTLTKWNARL